jgi:hypothetical protein
VRIEARTRSRHFAFGVSAPRVTSPRMRGEVDRSEARSGEGGSPRAESLKFPLTSPLSPQVGRGRPSIEPATKVECNLARETRGEDDIWIRRFSLLGQVRSD